MLLSLLLSLVACEIRPQPLARSRHLRGDRAGQKPPRPLAGGGEKKVRELRDVVFEGVGFETHSLCTLNY